ncbi:MAG: P-loop NTPase family protein [Ktedonobacteraceae bacterium]
MSMRSQEQVALLTDYDANSAYSNAYYSLYATIRSHWDSEQERQYTLLLVAPTAYPEYAATAANVAIAAAQSGTPTILVDAEVHTSSLQQRFGLTKSAGLSELLSVEIVTTQNIETSLQQTFVPGLRLLGSGNASGGVPALLSTQLHDVVRCLREYMAQSETKPGIIIFHCAPVLSAPDASLLGAEVAQTLLTIVKGRTTRTQAKQAQEQLQGAYAHLGGIIIADL